MEKIRGQGPRATGLSRKDLKESDQLQPSALLRKKDRMVAAARNRTSTWYGLESKAMLGETLPTLPFVHSFLSSNFI